METTTDLTVDVLASAARFFAADPAALTITYERRTPVTMRLIGFDIVTRSGHLIPVLAANDGEDWADVRAAEAEAIRIAELAAKRELEAR